MQFIAMSSENVNLLATVLGLAALYVLQKLQAKKSDAKSDAVLKTTTNTNETVAKVYKLTDGALGAAKRSVAVSKQNTAVSLRTLANVTGSDVYSGQADAAEQEALVAKHDADEHDRRLAELDTEIQRRTAELAAQRSGSAAPELKKLAEVTANVALSVGDSKVAADKAAETAALAAGLIAEQRDADAAKAVK